MGEDEGLPGVPLASLLSDQEQRIWQSLISVVLSLPVVLDRELQRHEGLPHFEYSLMARLSEAPQARLRLGDLAQQTGSTLPRLSKAVTRCEREGWVLREADPSDGRSILAALTSAGRQRLTASMPTHIAQVRRLIFDPLTATAQRSLEPSLARIAAAVRQDLYQSREPPRTPTP